MMNAVRRFLSAALGRRLVASMVSVHVALTAVLLGHVSINYQVLLNEWQSNQARAYGRLLAESLLQHVMRHDLVALEEVLLRSKNLPSVASITVMDDDGRILGDTNVELVGKFLVDPSSRSLMTLPATAEGTPIVLTGADPLGETCTPLMIAGRRLGWVRVTLDRAAFHQQLSDLIRFGLIVGTSAILLGALVASLVARGITRRLSRELKAVRQYQTSQQIDVPPDPQRDEVGVLSRSLRQFMEEISEYRRHLLAEKERLEEMVAQRTEELHQVATRALDARQFAEDILSCTAVGVLVCNASDRCVIANKSATSLLEIPDALPPEFDLNLLEFFRLTGVAERVREAREGGSVIGHRLTLRKREEGMSTLECNFVLFNSNAEQFLLCEFKDVSKEEAYLRHLEAARLELQTLVDNIPGLIFFKDTDNRLLRVNRYMAEAYQLSKEDLEGKPLEEIASPELARKYREDDLQVIQNKRPSVSYEEPWETATGMRWVLTSKVPITGEDGAVKGILGISLDVTERKQAQSALDRMTARFSAIYEQSQEGIAFADLRGQILMANPALCELSGYSSSEITTLSLMDLAIKDSTFPQMRQMVFQQRPAPSETRMKRRDGSLFWAYLSCVHVRVGDEEYVQALIRDISEQKRINGLLRENEERFQTIFSQSPDPILLLDPSKNQLVDCNLAAERMFLSPRRELLERHWDFETELLSPVSGKADPAAHGPENLPSKKFESTYDRPISRFDGTTSWVSITSTPIVMNERALVLATLRDISERRALETDLQRSNKELEQFAYQASHDLQEPLRMVASYTELLAQRYRGRLDEKADRYIYYAVDGARRMQTLISDLLSYSRIGTRSKVRKVISLNDCLASALANLKIAIDETHAEITFENLPSVPASRTQLEQLFQNLLGNALKFHGEAPPKVHVAAKRVEDQWLFSVQDNGIGIDPEFSDRIFGLFQRIHSQSRFKGSGIGLAICKKIVELHGGRIWVESTPGRGSTFYFNLPAAGPRPQSDPSP